MESSTVSVYPYYDSFEISLKEAVILSLGAVRIPYIFSEAIEIFDVFNEKLTSPKLYGNISNNTFKEYLNKLVRLKLVKTSTDINSKKLLHTYELTEKGFEEYNKIIEIIPDSVSFAIRDLKQYLGVLE
jgi:predicted transcriptional regulator